MNKLIVTICTEQDPEIAESDIREAINAAAYDVEEVVVDDGGRYDGTEGQDTDDQDRDSYRVKED